MCTQGRVVDSAGNVLETSKRSSEFRVNKQAPQVQVRLATCIAAVAHVSTQVKKTDVKDEPVIEEADPFHDERIATKNSVLAPAAVISDSCPPSATKGRSSLWRRAASSTWATSCAARPESRSCRHVFVTMVSC